MPQVLSSEDIVRNILQEALDHGSHTEMTMSNGTELFEELRRDFPQAKIVTLSLSEILAAVQESVQSEDE